MPIPNYKDKYSSASVFSPADSDKYRKGSGRAIMPPLEGAIFCYSRYLMDYISNNYRCTKVKGYDGCDVYLFNEYEGRIGIAGNFGIGAPISVSLLEEMVCLGVKEFISIGTAGTLQKDLKAGDIIVCDRAIRDEGTSYHYVKPAKYAHASSELTARLQKSLEAKKIPYRTGTSWTTDAPYRETIAEVKHYQEEGVLTVDMEASALFVVAEFRKVNTGALFTVSDSLADLEWKPEFHSEKTIAGLITIFETALHVFSSGC